MIRRSGEIRVYSGFKSHQGSRSRNEPPKGGFFVSAVCRSV